MPHHRHRFQRITATNFRSSSVAARLKASLVWLCFVAGLWGCAGIAPESRVIDNVWQSSIYPDVTIAPVFIYLGRIENVSLASHDVETHVFGEPDGDDNRLKRVIAVRVLRLKNQTDWLTPPFDGRSCSAGSGAVRIGGRMHPYCMDFVRSPLAPYEQQRIEAAGYRMSGPYFNRSFGRNAGRIRIEFSYSETIQYLGDTAGYSDQWDDLPPPSILRPDYITDMNRRCMAAIRVAE
jgi:hypothetical protein